MSDELKQQEKILKDMVSQVEVYKKAGKLEAAARLEEQKDMLEVNFISQYKYHILVILIDLNL